jgi:2-phospho-L-lactate guanylyltransferase (CobY/MobA/RfbA family)
VVHGDLPELSAEDLTALLDAVGGDARRSIAPDAAESGTNGLALPP